MYIFIPKWIETQLQITPQEKIFFYQNPEKKEPTLQRKNELPVKMIAVTFVKQRIITKKNSLIETEYKQLYFNYPKRFQEPKDKIKLNECPQPENEGILIFEYNTQVKK